MNVNTGAIYESRAAALADLKPHETPDDVVEISGTRAAIERMSQAVKPDNISILLLIYSEWLDVNGLMRTPRQSGDPRTHDEIVKAFRAGNGRVVA